MINDGPIKLPPAPAGALKRPRYEVGDYLAADDLLTEQRYRGQRLRRHNRHLHGWGVICGLRVVPAHDSGRPWAVYVCPGYAIGPHGDEIEVSRRVIVDIRDYLWMQPRQPPARVAYIGVRYAEEDTRPVPANPPQCGCADTVYKPSRIRDTYEVSVLWSLPEVEDVERFDLCAQDLAPCPDCPESPYVILARVTLPASEGDPITSVHIDNWTHSQ